MRIETYGKYEITILDAAEDAAADLPQGMVVARFGAGWAAFDVNGDEVITMTGARAVESAEAAAAVHREAIDSWTRSEELHRVTSLQAPVPVGPVPGRVEESENPILGRRAALEVRAHLIADIFNALPPAAPQRAALLEAIKGATSLLHGFVMTPDGLLRFDEVRYSLGVYRRKQARYAKAALEQLQKAAGEVLMTNDFLDYEARTQEYQQLEGAALAPMPSSPLEIFSEATRVFQVALASTANVQQRLSLKPVDQVAPAASQIPADGPGQQGLANSTSPNLGGVA